MQRLEKLPILVIEDDLSSRKLLTLLLTEAGAFVTAVGNAEEAIALLRQQTQPTPRVVVLDLVLPRMSGLLFIEMLKADPATRDIVVVVVTALNGEASERIAMAAGCAAYVRKPVDTETFAQTIASQLELNPQ